MLNGGGFISTVSLPRALFLTSPAFFFFKHFCRISNGCNIVFYVRISVACHRDGAQAFAQAPIHPTETLLFGHSRWSDGFGCKPVTQLEFHNGFNQIKLIFTRSNQRVFGIWQMKHQRCDLFQSDERLGLLVQSFLRLIDRPALAPWIARFHFNMQI